MKTVLNKKLNLIMAISIFLLVLFGFYKNGISLYQKDYISFFEMFKPLIIVLMSISGSIIGSFIRERKKSKKIKLDYLENVKTEILEGAILACTMPISTSPLILFVVVLLVYAFVNKTKINRIALLFLLMSGINALLKINVFENAYELSTELHYSSLDLFFGMGIGGIASTCIFLIGISLLILSFNKLYKSSIAIFSTITFTLLTLIIAIITNNYSTIFKTLFSHNILFAFVFAAPVINSSCYTDKGQVLSGILLGIITVILSYFIPYEAVFVAILLISLIKNIIDRIFVII